MTIAFVLGNGASRKDVDLSALKNHGKVYGCNALYRDFTPDVLVATEIPITAPNQVYSFIELARRHGDYAVAGLAAVAQKQSGGLHACRLAFFSVASTPIMATTTQDFLEGKKLNQETISEAVKLARQEIETLADITNSAEMKTHLLGVLLERTLLKMSA